jgi:endonuclease YncB( thermonuclease family)
MLWRDAALDDRDEHGRLLRYIQLGVEEGLTATVNLELVRQGAAVPYFFRGERGVYADELLSAAKDARREHRGLWGACPGAKLDPNRGSLTGPM